MTNELFNEALEHGRTQEKLTMAVVALRQILKLAIDPKQKPAAKIAWIHREAEKTLEVLGKANGGVIDDMAPMSPRRIAK